MPNDVHVKMAASSTDDASCVDANDSDARIFHISSLLFLIGFHIPIIKVIQESVMRHGVSSKSMYFERPLEDHVL